ncbi:alpha/beta hydrolase [uncultured Fluviicola sp.]|uniref:alpha/beta fold hydrolase n=1 Tax=uncultured Fluviicola sp. TaxID=463303 RepID=UPI0025D078E9|nr:alpha/beta hydrolase [uncultured Fluviicola sp.]
MKKRFLFSAIILLSQSTFSQKAASFTQVSQKGSPIIFLPHIGCSSDMWKDIAAQYRENYSVYLADFAGFNGKQALDSNFTESYVKEIQQFIREKQLKQVVLAGQNYGAFIAVKVAADKRLPIQSIVAVDFYPCLSMVLDPNMSAETLESVKESIRQSAMQSDDSTFAAIQRQTAEMMNFSNPEDVDRFVKWQLNSDRKTLSETLCDQFASDLRSALKERKIPILVCSTWYFARKYKNMPLSEADGKMKEMYGDIPNVTHAITEDAKDFIASDQPEWFVKQVNTFLKKLELGK